MKKSLLKIENNQVKNNLYVKVFAHIYIIANEKILIEFDKWKKENSINYITMSDIVELNKHSANYKKEDAYKIIDYFENKNINIMSEI